MDPHPVTGPFEQWERFVDALPPSERDGDLAAAYARLLQNPDAQSPAVPAGGMDTGGMDTGCPRARSRASSASHA